MFRNLIYEALFAWTSLLLVCCCCLILETVLTTVDLFSFGMCLSKFLREDDTISSRGKIQKNSCLSSLKNDRYAQRKYKHRATKLPQITNENRKPVGGTCIFKPTKTARQGSQCIWLPSIIIANSRTISLYFYNCSSFINVILIYMW
jgi:hypothetical protein